ncbi:non-ribosomal peptide synthase/polyketide synthase [Flavobacteriaceae bacterium M23B6Z8]
MKSSNLTIIDKLVRHSKTSPDKIVYRFLENGEDETCSFTYAELESKTSLIAANILQHTKKGERALLLYPSGLDFIAAFLACLRAGVIAVPAYPPSGKRRLSRLEGIVKDCKANLILSTENIAAKGKNWFGQSEVLKDVSWLLTDTLEELYSSEIDKIQEQDIAFLQYTSGSTGDPKGVMVSHRNLYHNELLIRDAMNHDVDLVIVGWLPVYHDMGLIGNLLQPLFMGGTSVFMPPTAFIQKPLKWLQAITKFKATTAGAPNFAYDLCVSAIKKEDLDALDLSSWKVAYNGSEPIKHTTLEQFATYFKGCGFDAKSYMPCYGMAETTLFVSGLPFEDTLRFLTVEKDQFLTKKIVPIDKESKVNENQLKLTSCGHIAKELEVLLVNPENLKECEPNEIGEIWISGDSVAKGYWMQEQKTKEIFHAYNEGKGPFLRTGDMGFIYKDDLYITGRLKEMFIINGANHYPQDIERTVQQADDSLQENACAVFSIEKDGNEEIVVAQEIKRTSLKEFDVQQVAGNICKKVLEQHQLPVAAIMFLSPGRLLKTSSGKIKRVATKKAYEANKMEGVLHTWNPDHKTEKQNENEYLDASISVKKLDLNETEKWLMEILSNELQIEKNKINAHKSFAEMGITSLQGIRLSGFISDYVGREITPATLYSYSNIRGLATYLSGAQKERLDFSQFERIENEPIAIIGMACRFPGASDIESFWDNLCKGKDCIREVPADKWDVEAFFNAVPDGRHMNTRYGGFIENADLFDASFFDILPREARLMDPQQRILLELSHELIENAGYAPENLQGSKTGVFIGIIQSDYAQLLKDEDKDIFSGTGAALSMASNRLSYYYDFRGPSLSIDTACSSSLVSVHTAVQNIRNGQCKMAIAGGVNLILSPDSTIALSQAGMMSPDGRCKTFDDDANGYVRSEGCGLILLKPLKDAISDGDEVLSVIRGSAINQDGRSNGLTAPNGLAQQEVIKMALKDASVKPAQIKYAEAHGTGTALGDPIEIEALDAVYGKQRDHQDPLVVGAVKSNIGHLEAAAGIAGLIKAVLCIQHQKIPQQLHFKKPNKFINWKNHKIQIPERLVSWESKKHETRKACVSSFGFGGANAHIILEEPLSVRTNQETAKMPARPVQLLPLSAKSNHALSEYANSWSDYLKKNPTVALEDLAYSQAICRSHYAKRAALQFQNLEELEAGLSRLKEGSFQEPINLKTAFLFTGQGSQYAGMAKNLYESEPVFKDYLDQCTEVLNSIVGFDLLDILFDDADKNDLINQTRYTQPILFSVEYALSKLWESWGVSPSIVMGHSIGEIVAACFAGIFSLPDALKLVSERGKLMQSLPENGKMISLQCDKETVDNIYQDKNKGISVAAYNGASQIVLSGEMKALESLIKELDRVGIKHKELNVSHAFHSPLMQPIIEEFRRVAESITYHLAKLPVVSNISGAIADKEMSTAEYWVSHIIEPVDFEKSMSTLEDLSINVYLEVGPHPVLITMGSECVKEASNAIWLSSMRKGKDELSYLTQNLGEWYEHGGQVDWEGFYNKRKARKINCPVYPFQRESFWLKSKAFESSVVRQNTDTELTTNKLSMSSAIFENIEKDLRGLISQSLEIDPSQLVLESSLLEFGADSLVLMEIVRKIEKEYQLKIPVRRLFEDLTDFKSIITFILDNSKITQSEQEKETVSEVTTESKNDIHSGEFSSTNLNSIQNIQEGNNTTLSLLLNQFSEQNKILSEQNKLISGFLATSNHQEEHEIRNTYQVNSFESSGVAPIKNKRKQDKTTLPSSFGDKNFYFSKLPDNQEEQLPELIDAFTVKTPRSKAYADKYRDVLADYRSTLGFRIATKEMVYPIVSASAEGSKFTDIDGNEYVDITMGMGSCIFGHQPDFIIEAIEAQLKTGINIGPLANLSGEVASLISQVTGMERVCFANTGSEAVSFALRMARTATGKNKIVIFSGSYHGHSELILGIQGDEEGRVEPMVAGVTPDMVNDLIVLNYQDDDILEQIRAHRDELAGVMIEPVRSRFPGFQPRELIEQLRELTRELDVPLIFDEMITGFRIMPGGAQQYFGVRADIATYGKIVGGGMPIGVVAGSPRYLDTVDGGTWRYGDESYPQSPKTLIAGTFTRHPLALAAAKAILVRIQEIGDVAYEELNNRTAELMKRLNAFFEAEELPIQMVHFGSLFRFKFTGNFDLFLFHLIEKGIYAWAANNLFLSFAHTDDDLDKIFKVISESALQVSAKKSLKKKQSFSSDLSSIETTQAQKQLYFLEQIDPELSKVYTLSFSIKLEGALDTDSLKKSFEEVFSSHRILQTYFSEDGETLVFDKSQSISFLSIDLSEEDDDKRELKYRKLVEEDLDTSFDFNHGHLIRWKLVKMSAEQHIMLLSAHHSIADGWSCALIIRELAQNYNLFSQGKQPQLQEKLQFTSYVKWLNQNAKSAEWSIHENYFLETFGKKNFYLELPSDRALASKGHLSKTSYYKIDAEKTANLKNWCSKNGLTPFMLFLGAYELLLFKLTKKNEIVIGVPNGGRTMPGIENSVGYFSHIMPIASSIDESSSAMNFLSNLKKRLFDAYDHEIYPYANFLNLMQEKGYMTGKNTINVNFNFDVNVGNISMNGLKLQLEENRPLYLDLDLSLNAIEQDGEILLSLDYLQSKFSDHLVNEFMSGYIHILDQVTGDPKITLAGLELLSPEKKTQILSVFNDTNCDLPLDKGFVALFEKQAKNTPDAVAVTFEDQQLSYKQLDEYSNQLANLIVSKELRSEELIAVCMDRSANMIISILAVFKAGMAYVPIKPDYPQDRINFIIEDAGCELIIFDESSYEIAGSFTRIAALIFDKNYAFIADQSKDPLNIQIDPQQLAYVIFTSGSTGKPKGAMVEHKGMLNHMFAKIEGLEMNADTVLAFTAPFTFDISVWQMFSPLLLGAKVAVYRDEVVLDPKKLIESLYEDKVTILQLVPSYVMSLLEIETESNLNHLKYFVVTGEAVSPAILAEWFAKFPNVPVANAYGPTECSDDVSTHFMTEAPDVVNVSIGKPMLNTQLYVVDTSHQLCPIGIAGELWVSGVGVGRGYLNNSQKTEDTFISNPFPGGPRVYKTGDLARWLPDGTLEYLGRKDSQIKIRGYRIELGEIESLLSELPGVRTACVLALTDTKGTKYLTGYVVMDTSFDKTYLENELAAKLPDYMVPKVWVFLDEMPLTAHGKIDRKVLPLPDAEILSTANYAPPVTDLEHSLAGIWQDLLGIEKIGIHDNFFELGGHSLLATRLTAKIRKELLLELAIAAVFKHPTISLLAQKLGDTQKGVALPAIQFQERPEKIPLSFSQERLWFIDQLQGSVEYHIPIVLELQGSLSIDHLRTALQTIVARHEVLRTVIHTESGTGYQKVQSSDSWSLTLRDLEDERTLESVITDYIAQPFDLSADYMFRALLLGLSDQKYVLTGVFHHIASDGWSNGILVAEFVAIYNSLQQGVSPGLPPLEVQYADYALWQRSYIEGAILDHQLRYWEEQLQGVSPLLMPTDYPRPSVQSIRGGTLHFSIDASLTRSLEALSQSEGVTMFMTLLSAFKVLLYRYSRQEDICVGTPIANRTREEVSGLIGYFANTLALRSDLSGNPTFRELLQAVKQTTLEGYDHQDAPFEKVVDRVVTSRDMSMSPLFQVMFVIQDDLNIYEKVALDDVAVSAGPSLQNTSKFDITLTASLKKNDISFEIEYCKDLFTYETIHIFSQSFEELLRSVIDDVSLSIDSINLVSSETRHRLLHSFNDTEKVYPKNKTVVDLFENFVKETPEATALVFREETLTYNELHQKVNRFAKYLVDRSVTKGSHVGLFMEPSFDLIIAILAVLKTGATYIPLDTAYPTERIKFILEDAGISVLLSNTDYSHLAEIASVEHLAVDEVWKESETEINFENLSTPGQIAYVIYTSGSTGTPKGVLITNESLTNYVNSSINTYTSHASFSSGSYAHLSVSFDASVTEIFTPLCSGKSLIIGSLRKTEVFNDPNFLKYAPYDFLKLTPAHLELLKPVVEKLGPSKKLTGVFVLGGEALYPHHTSFLKEHHGDVTVFNEYGPTEATVGCSGYEFEVHDEVRSFSNGYPIGKPMGNMEIYILNESDVLQPLGSIGELCISGIGLSVGYLNQEQLTNSKFIQHPFKSKERLYKTGDLARWLPDGNIAFEGRKDNQLKHKGYRIEPGEIETVLNTLQTVQQSIIIPLKNGSGDQILAGYIVPDGTFDKELLQRELSDKLPAYMIPDVWTEIESIPLTVNGKIDKKALPVWEELELSTKKYEAPTTIIEKQLTQLWQELLGLDKIGINDNFFEIGGHSLLVMRLIAAIKMAMKKEVSIADIFQNPSIKKLASIITEDTKAFGLPVIQKADKADASILSFSQERLWFIDKLQGSVDYHIPVALHFKGKLDITLLETSLRCIVDRHEVLRTLIKDSDEHPSGILTSSEDWKIEQVNQFSDLEDIRKDIRLFIATPFDLSADYMFKARIYHIDEEEFILTGVFHHIASDGWSNAILIKEFTTIYDDLYNKKQISLEPLEFQYSDYALWQRTYLEGEVIDLQLKYWERKLHNSMPLLLPTDYERPSVLSTKGSSITFELAPEISQSLRQIANTEGVTMFMLLLSAFKTLMFRYTGQSDICIGIPVANRSQQEVQNLIGYFVNTLAIRSDLHDDLSFSELLQNVKRTTLEAFDHQWAPFEKVVEKVVETRDRSLNPLVQVMFDLQSDVEVVEDISLPDASVSSLDIENEISQFDLTLVIKDRSESLGVEIEYCTDLFKAETIERMMFHFQMILGHIAEAPEKQIGHLSLLPPTEIKQVKELFHGAKKKFDLTKTVVDLFEEQVHSNPESTALEFGNKKLSYGELNRRSNRIAEELLSSGVDEGSLVVLSLEKSFEIVAGMIGILKTGGTYIPIDPNFPVDRKLTILKESKSKFVLTTKGELGIYNDYATSIDINDIKGNSKDVKSKGKPDGLAYIIYSSGTTGKPKGIKISHKSLSNLLHDYNKRYQFNKSSKVLQLTNLVVDIAFQEIFSTLINGATLVIPEEEIILDRESIRNLIDRHEINFIQTVPDTLRTFFSEGDRLESLQYILCGGDKLENSLKDLIVSKGYPLYNIYGQTETTIDALVSKCEIGKTGFDQVVANYEVYILNDAGQIQPSGVTGELCIAGIGVSEGYLDPAQESSKFVTNPFGQGKMYRTGDLGTWHEDGRIEFKGRIDDQVKIRGYRIELSEVETVIHQFEEVEDAVVRALEDVSGNKRLVGYVVSKGEFDRYRVENYIKGQLPQYMIPQFWVPMDSFPVSVTGKVDKKSLPEPDLTLRSESTYKAPETSLQKELAEIWEQLLEVEKISIHDNFFELGGHSLLATRLVSLIRKELKREVSIAAIFEHSTIATQATYLARNASLKSLPEIEASRTEKDIPLSFSQERLWFLDQSQGSTEYHMPVVLELRGKLNVSVLEDSFKYIIHRHQILRTVINDHEGTGLQGIIPAESWKMDVERIDAIEKIPSVIKSFVNRPFDLTSDYMFRACLYELPSDQFILAGVFHHISGDGWSNNILIKEVVTVYNALSRTETVNLEPLSLQYADYAIWQRKHLEGNFLDTQLLYWENKLTGVSSLLLPTDHPRPSLQSKEGDVIHYSIDSSLSEAINAYAKEEGCTLFMVLLTAFKILLYRYTNQDDICVGTPVANRTQHSIENLIGYFINTLALRSDLSGNPDFKTLLQQIRQTTLEGYDHQMVPFEKVVERVVSSRDLRVSPLFQVMFVLQNTADISDQIELEGLEEVKKYETETVSSKFDITLTATESDEGIQLELEYCTAIFEKSRMERMLLHYERLLAHIISNPEASIDNFSILTPAEENQLLNNFAGSHLAYPRKSSVVDLFEKQVKSTPEAIALSFGETQLSYKELNKRVNQLASYLIKKGIGENSFVGICLDRSADLLIAVLGVIKTGAAYVPIDTSYPEERIAFMLSDTNAAYLITNSQKDYDQKILKELSLIQIDRIDKQLRRYATSNIKVSIPSDALFYVMYTSGSTGTPKGVLVSHRNVVSLATSCDYVALNSDTRWLSTGSVSFDATTIEFWGTLLNGGTLVITDSETLLNTSSLGTTLKHHNVNTLWMTASWFHQVVEEDITVFEGLEYLLVGGDKVLYPYTNKVKSKYPSLKLINGYGPTENTTFSTTHNIEGNLTKDVPIGKPIKNREAYIFHPGMQSLQPVGVPGELCLSGDGLSKGYLNQEFLTIEKFVHNPLKKDAIIYKTGDLAYWKEDGTIVFAGRKDDQVKLRGYRIELGEIEKALQKLESVHQSVVVLKTDEAGNKRLVGYLATEDGTYNRTEIEHNLKEQLPDYMIPQMWVSLKSLPLTTNGKVNKEALPDVNLEELSTANYAPPVTDLEHSLAGIWQDLLGIEKIGIHDNFFELGGHSLLATRLTAKIRKELLLELAIAAVFKHPTISLLAQKLGDTQKGVALPAIQFQERPEKIPLSFSQERLWFIDQLQGSVEYHIPIVLELQGSLSIDHLETALQTIVARHEVLRTVIHTESGTGYQKVQSSDSWSLTQKDLEDERTLESVITDYIAQPFDLSADYMFRALLLGLSDQKYVLTGVFHHIASDGWSNGILVAEFVAIYNSLQQGVSLGLPPLEVQYADYALWQRSYIEGAILDHQLRYWEEQLQGVSPLLMPTDYPRPSVQSIRGGTLHFSIDASLTRSLEALSQSEGVTMFMTLLSAFKVLLYRYSRQEDICVGTPIANRTREEVSGLIGYFANTLALRSDLSGNPTFRELLQAVKQTTLEGYDHQDAPFEKVVDRVVTSRDMSMSPLFQVMFVMQNNPVDNNPVTVDGITISHHESENFTTKFDITLTATQEKEQLFFELEYCSDLFKENTIQRLWTHYEGILHSIIENLQSSIHAIQMLSTSEKLSLLETFETEQVDYPKNETIVSLIESQVKKTPNAIAVIHEEETISYDELNKRSNQLARFLQKKGVVTETLVGLCLDRSIEIIVAMLGILKSGGAYVPIDPDYPEDRIEFMIEDSAMQFVVTTHGISGRLPDKSGLEIISLDKSNESIQKLSKAKLRRKVQSGDLAYVIYTSGSTGKPKGVLIEHHNVVRLFKNEQALFDFNEYDVWSVFHSFCFDFSVWEMYGALFYGGRMVIVSKEVARDTTAFAKLLVAEKVTVLNQTPSAFYTLQEYSEELSRNQIRYVIFGGEALKPSYLKPWRTMNEHARLINMYGITETTVHVTYKEINDEDIKKATSNIGKAIPTLSCVVLDEALNLNPVGVPGELYVSGAGLSRGYLNRNKLTSERFITNPFDETKQSRLYKTGDLVRRLSNGDLEYLGRIDHQVKIRGYRIELGEIENALQEIEIIKQSVVLAKEDHSGAKRLVVYFTASEAFNKSTVEAELKTKLPGYMVPRIWIELEVFPLTSNGKIDQKALPSPDSSMLTQQAFVAPSNEIEIKLAAIWQELLGVEKIGIHDDFFELGGHSLLATRVISAIKEELELEEIPVSFLFKFPNIADVARYIKIAKVSQESDEDQEDLRVIEL